MNRSTVTFGTINDTRVKRYIYTWRDMIFIRAILAMRLHTGTLAKLKANIIEEIPLSRLYSLFVIYGLHNGHPRAQTALCSTTDISNMDSIDLCICHGLCECTIS